MIWFCYGHLCFVLRTTLFTHEIVRRGVGHLRSYRKSTGTLVRRMNGCRLMIKTNDFLPGRSLHYGTVSIQRIVPNAEKLLKQLSVFGRCFHRATPNAFGVKSAVL